jgi:hypothetical protein
MAHGHYEGRTINDPGIRDMFTRESLLASDWYKERLRIKQQRDIALWERHAKASNSEAARQRLAQVASPEYLGQLEGTIGADPIA